MRFRHAAVAYLTAGLAVLTINSWYGAQPAPDHAAIANCAAFSVSFAMLVGAEMLWVTRSLALFELIRGLLFFAQFTLERPVALWFSGSDAHLRTLAVRGQADFICLLSAVLTIVAAAFLAHAGWRRDEALDSLEL